MDSILLLIGSAAVGFALFGGKSKTESNIVEEEDGSRSAIIPMDSIHFGTIDEYENDVDLDVTSAGWMKFQKISSGTGIYRSQGYLVIKNTSSEEVTIEYPDLQLGNYIPQKGANGYFDKMVSSAGANLSYMTSWYDGKVQSGAVKVLNLAAGETKKVHIQFSINTNENNKILLNNNTNYYKFPFSVVMNYSVGKSPGSYTICSVVEANIPL